MGPSVRPDQICRRRQPLLEEYADPLEQANKYPFPPLSCLSLCARELPGHVRWRLQWEERFFHEDAGACGVRCAAINVRKGRTELRLHRVKPGVGDFILGPDNNGGDVGVLEKAERIGQAILEEVVDLFLAKIGLRRIPGGFLRIGPAEVATVFRESGESGRLEPGVPRISGEKGLAVNAFERLFHLIFHGIFPEKVVTLEMKHGRAPGAGVAEDRPCGPRNNSGEDHRCRETTKNTARLGEEEGDDHGDADAVRRAEDFFKIGPAVAEVDSLGRKRNRYEPEVKPAGHRVEFFPSKKKDKPREIHRPPLDHRGDEITRIFSGEIESLAARGAKQAGQGGVEQKKPEAGAEEDGAPRGRPPVQFPGINQAGDGEQQDDENEPRTRNKNQHGPHYEKDPGEKSTPTPENLGHGKYGQQRNEVASHGSMEFGVIDIAARSENSVAIVGGLDKEEWREFFVLRPIDAVPKVNRADRIRIRRMEQGVNRQAAGEASGQDDECEHGDKRPKAPQRIGRGCAREHGEGTDQRGADVTSGADVDEEKPFEHGCTVVHEGVVTGMGIRRQPAILRRYCVAQTEIEDPVEVGQALGVIVIDVRLEAFDREAKEERWDKQRDGKAQAFPPAAETDHGEDRSAGGERKRNCQHRQGDEMLDKVER